MKTTLTALIVLLLTASAAYAAWQFGFKTKPDEPLVLLGNIDLRQVDLPFNAQQRVDFVCVEEGDRVERGQLLARLETFRLDASLAETIARIEAQKHVIYRLDNGTRPEELAQARANVAAAVADYDYAKLTYDRRVELDRKNAATRREVDEAKAALDHAVAKLNVQKQSLELAIAGPRAEDRAEARATLEVLEAQLALRQRELDDTQLRSPVKGVVRNRILEPGEMSSPGAAAMTIAVSQAGRARRRRCDRLRATGPVRGVGSSLGG